MSSNVFYIYFAEFFLVSVLFLILILNLILSERRIRSIIERFVLFELFLLFGLMFYLYLKNYVFRIVHNDPVFLTNAGISLLKIIIILISIGTLPLVVRFYKNDRINNVEFFILYLSSILASLVMFSCYDLMTNYMLIEMQSLCFYILASFKRSPAGGEAGLRYFISSVFFSCIFLLGVSIVYGLFGTLNLKTILTLTSIFLTKGNIIAIYLLGFGFFCISVFLLFKLIVIPFHFWFPQIYDGAPLSSTIIFSTLPKFPFFILLLKCVISFSWIAQYYQGFFIIVGMFANVIGMLYALKQTRFKKLIIYSSLSQIGYPIALLGVLTSETIAFIIYFLIIYQCQIINLWYLYSYVLTVKNIHTSAALDNEDTSIYLADIKNFVNIFPELRVPFVLMFFSLSGIPFLVGFYLKTFMFASLLRYSPYLAVFLIVCSVVSVFYYIRIITIIFYENKKNMKLGPKVEMDSFKKIIVQQNLILESFFICVFSIIILFGFIFPDSFLMIANTITMSLF